MTLHAAKGLEFRCVFIVGCEDGLLPYSLYESQTCDADEERRLLYVGMTRAKEFLFLCHAEKRFVRGREFHLKRSPFLDPIEKELIELSQMKKRKPKEKEYTQPTLFGKDEL
jgi:superfamily I DNA/RNA helicase